MKFNINFLNIDILSPSDLPYKTKKFSILIDKEDKTDERFSFHMAKIL